MIQQYESYWDFVFHKFGGQLTFEFSILQVSEMLISRYVSFGSNGSDLIVIYHL
jgi:hypothetical protein